MENKKRNFPGIGFEGRTRIEVIRDFDDKKETREERRIRREGKALAQNNFIRTIQNARERLEEIAEHLDDHLGFAPTEVTFDAAEIAQTILNKLDEALTAADKTADLNQALHQADKDNPARS